MMRMTLMVDITETSENSTLHRPIYTTMNSDGGYNYSGESGENEHFNDSNVTGSLGGLDFSTTKQNTFSFMKPTFGSIGFGIPDSPLAIQIVNYCFGVTLIMIGLAGICGNGLVLYVFTRYRRLRGGGGPLILSLSGGDFFVSLLHILPAYSSFNERWAFGSLGCSLYAASVGLCGLASLLTLSAIAADRFSVIFGHRLPWLAKKQTCLVIWIVSLCLVTPPFLGWSQYCTEGMGTSCSWDYQSRDPSNRLYYIFLLAFGFIVPVSIITVSYIGILRTVCKQQSGVVLVENGLNSAQKVPTKSDMKTAQVVFIIIICFLTAWTPYAIVSAVGQFGDKDILSPLVTAIPGIFAKTSVVFNPIVYGLSHPHFRSALRTLNSRSCCSTSRRRRHYDRYYYHQNNYEQNPHQYHRHNHENNKFCVEDRKCGISKPWSCVNVKPGGSPQVLLRDSRNIHRHRSTVWHFQQTGSSKTPSEPRTTTGQMNNNNTGVGNLSNQTVIQMLDTVTPTAARRDLGTIIHQSINSPFSSHSYTTDPTYGPEYVPHSTGPAFSGVHVNHVTARPDTSWKDRTRNLSEPDLNLLELIMKVKQGALNERNNSTCESARMDLKTALTTRRKKSSSCSRFLEKNTSFSRSENCLVPLRGIEKQQHHHQYRHYQHTHHDQSHLLFSGLQKRFSSAKAMLGSPKSNNDKARRATTTKCSCYCPPSETTTAATILPCRVCNDRKARDGKKLTTRPALKRVSKRTPAQHSKGVCIKRKKMDRARRNTIFGGFHRRVQSPCSNSDQMICIERNAMSVADSMDEFYHDYNLSSTTTASQTGNESSEDYIRTTGVAGWRDHHQYNRYNRYSRDGNHTDSGIHSVIIPSKKSWLNYREKMKECERLRSRQEKSCPECSCRGISDHGNNTYSLDDGFYSSFI